MAYPSIPVRPWSRMSAAMLSMSLITACVTAPSGTQGDPDPAGDPPQAITLTFKAMVGDQELVTSGNSPRHDDPTYDGVGQDAKTVRPADFRFYVHDVQLLTADGAPVSLTLEQNAWQYQNLALLDFETAATAETNATVTGTAPRGTYTGIRFTLGVPHELNHTDPGAKAAHGILSKEDLATGLTWPWLMGRIYGRFEFYVKKADNQEQIFRFHLGGTGATNPTYDSSYDGFNPLQTVLKNPNRPVITLPNFDPSKDVVAADLKTLFANIFVAEGGHFQPVDNNNSLNSDTEILLKNLGLAGASEQKLFRKL